MKLVRPDLFDPEKPEKSQLPLLNNALIRNNKQSVTDMSGEKLFKPVKVYQETYSYSEEEAFFYELLTEFILTGRAYASRLSNSNNQRAVMLVLISLQKLASSSIAAIRRAIENRLNKLTVIKKDLTGLEAQKERLDAFISLSEEGVDSALTDEVQALEEDILEITAKLSLMEDEKPRLEALLDAANKIVNETKLIHLLLVLEERYDGRNVLFFTEYKATQSLLMSMLQKKYGDGCVVFINGDSCAYQVKNQSGALIDLHMSRDDAVYKFNSGEVRFIVSTEAGGEGIDLQDNCYSMVHVDLPWNPMRMHQRVGRLNRYGQKNTVEVLTLRNPDTVESRIWDMLNEKLNDITLALSEVMDEPEDLLQLVLGMSDGNVFNQLFSKGLVQSTGTLKNWFDKESKQFGGEDAIQAVKDLVGNSQQFDYQSLDAIPKRDLNDLQPFFESMLIYNQKRILRAEKAISFNTPDCWKVDMGVRNKYDGLIFDRDHKQSQASEKVIGVGHKAFDLAVKQALSLTSSLCVLPNFEQRLVVFSIYDRVTGIESNVSKTIVGVISYLNKKNEILFDWQVLDILNQLKLGKPVLDVSHIQPKDLSDYKTQCLEFLKRNISNLKLPYTIPEIDVLAILWPSV
jgi:hypothetical protein